MGHDAEVAVVFDWVLTGHGQILYHC
jgi:hypothetical protein